jgi:hypothetical protein
MSRPAEETGSTRQALYKAPSGEGNPEFAAVLKVNSALGLPLLAHTPVVPIHSEDEDNAALLNKLIRYAWNAGRSSSRNADFPKIGCNIWVRRAAQTMRGRMFEQLKNALQFFFFAHLHR